MSKLLQNIVYKRIAEVSEMLIEGKSRAHIVQYSSDNWNIGERQTDKYISKAREYLLSEIKRDIEYDYAKAMKRFESLYNKAIDKKDYKLALAINKEICAIQGLHKIQIDHTGEFQFISNIPE